VFFSEHSVRITAVMVCDYSKRFITMPQSLLNLYLSPLYLQEQLCHAVAE